MLGVSISKDHLLKRELWIKEHDLWQKLVSILIYFVLFLSP